MSIKQLSISNFQSHKKSVLNLHPGVNVIVGSSDSGKSAILRALGWVIKNRVDDKGFRSSWGGKTDVEITFNDGKEVSRVQDNGNYYFLVDSKNNIDVEFKAFKTDIPEDIVNALNMDSINISSQFDAPFLLSDSPSDVAKTLNKIANLSDIDNAISNIRKMVLSNSKDITYNEGTLSDLETQRSSFSYLDEIEKDVTAYEQLIIKVNKFDAKIPMLEDIIRNIEADKNNLDEIESCLTPEE